MHQVMTTADSKAAATMIERRAVGGHGLKQELGLVVEGRRGVGGEEKRSKIRAATEACLTVNEGCHHGLVTTTGACMERASVSPGGTNLRRRGLGEMGMR